MLKTTSSLRINYLNPWGRVKFFLLETILFFKVTVTSEIFNKRSYWCFTWLHQKVFENHIKGSPWKSSAGQTKNYYCNSQCLWHKKEKITSLYYFGIPLWRIACRRKWREKGRSGWLNQYLLTLPIGSEAITPKLKIRLSSLVDFPGVFFLRRMHYVLQVNLIHCFYLVWIKFYLLNMLLTIAYYFSDYLAWFLT